MSTAFDLLVEIRITVTFILTAAANMQASFCLLVVLISLWRLIASVR